MAVSEAAEFGNGRVALTVADRVAVIENPQSAGERRLA